jgi:threonine synthase
MRPLKTFEPELINQKEHSLWRYAEFFPYVKETDIITLGEGWTPLVKFSNSIHFKLENLNPTGSFKDRGSGVLISGLHRLIKNTRSYIAEDSSGNAGASMAGYAARAGLRAKIYVPENVVGPKLKQTRFYGAEVVKVAGSRNEVAGAAQRNEKGKVYVGHILHPLFRDGIRSLAYEVAEQLNWQVSARIYLPASAGTLLLGMLSGFNHLVESGALKSVPKVVACQTSQVSPLYHRFENLTYKPPQQITSIADALVSTNPPLLNLMAKQLEAARGEVVMVDEKEIFRAFEELAHQGFFVEPSSAVAYAAYKKQLKNREASKQDDAIVILTGTGLKTMLESP